MKRKKLQSYHDIMNYLDNLNSERKIINSQLAVMGVSLFDDVARAKKKRLKSRLKEIKEIFKYFDELIKEYTTFDRSILLPFLAEFLSKNTDTKYVICNGESSVFTGKVWLYYYYNFIYPTRDILKFKCRGYDIDGNLDYDRLKVEASSRYIELDESRSYTLMNLNGLFKEFNNFPELEEAVIRLVDLKISQPSISDEERLLRVLKNVKTNQKSSIRSEYFDKENLNGKKLKNMSLSEIYSVKKR